MKNYTAYIGKTILHEIKYRSTNGSTKERFVKIVYPEIEKNRYPIVIATHYEVDFNDPSIIALLENGIAIATPTQIQPEHIQNIFADNVEFHLEYIRTISNLESIDRERIAFRGGSAGGFMALYMAGIFPWVKCVYCMSGVFNFIYEAKYLECSLNSNLEGVKAVKTNFHQTINYLLNENAYEKYSVVLHLDSIKSPVLLLHSTADSMVPINQFVDVENEKNCVTRIDKLVDSLGYRKTLKDFEGKMSYRIHNVKKIDGEIVSLKFNPSEQISFNMIDEGPVDEKSMHFKNCTHNYFSEVKFLLHYLK